MTLREVKAVQPGWFSKANMRFFNDVYYEVRRGASGRYWLVRCTAMWTDMFDRPKRYYFRVNALSEKGVIGSLVSDVFKNPDEVMDWLKDN